MPQEDGPYSAAWRRYRLWSRAFWIVFVGYLPAMAFVARVLGWAGQGNAIFLAAFVWMIGFALVGYQKGNFRCPRCGELSGPPWVPARHCRMRLDLDRSDP